MNLLDEVRKASAIARRNRHRFITMLCASKTDENVFKIGKEIFKTIKSNKTLIVGRSYFIEVSSKYLEGEFIHYKDCQKVLGQTYSSLVLDLTEGFNPNDLGILIETVAEGGLILIISPKIMEWNNLIGKWEEDISESPGVIPRFNRRFISRTLESDGIIIYDVDEDRIIKNYTYPEVEESRGTLEIPQDIQEIKRKLYKLCATQDQIRVLQLFETYFDRKKERKSVVITADRGRGKTAILGILTPYLISRMNFVLKRPVRILVVAPTPESIQTYFQFLKKSMVRQGMSDFRTRETRNLTTVLNSRFARVEYAIPRRALMEKEYADIVIVDEAAGIDINVLEKITENIRYTVFSSTIHGYEGAGRGIIRFLKKLEVEDIEIERIHLEEPVRYGNEDPVERWLYDVLLLDSQPAELNEGDIEKIKAGKLKFEHIDKDRLMADEKLLREYFGIYVLAHYRNRPSDLVILADFPNHFPFRVSVNGKTVCSIQVAIEGGMDAEFIKKLTEGFRPKGQIIPDLIVKHFFFEEFATSKGVRIVRIATHPSVTGMGVGSFALKKIQEWAKSEKLDWIGSGFGVSAELFNFWRKNGFLPVHITPGRNEVSGEHTTIVLKTLNREMKGKLSQINSEFIKRLIEYLGDELKDIEIETAIMLLGTIQRNAPLSKPKIKNEDCRRMEKYFEGLSLYEYISDVVRPLVKYYYSRAKRIELDEAEHEIVVGKCLQLKTWREVNNEYSLFQNSIKKIWKWYHGEN
ncbi:MAG TPA: tRNA(Met) cytidine acetyltransferase [Archaeoglobaceae archaeon]|nr:tRNA(Met) cytidine acetyltransferase [Archaeoglobaceae archaeon]